MIALTLPIEQYYAMDRIGKIIRIGNSHGVIIPASILKELSWGSKDEVEIRAFDGALYVKKIEPYTGPYTGIFADMPRRKPGEPDFWGDKSVDEIMEELRGGRYDRPKDLDW